MPVTYVGSASGKTEDGSNVVVDLSGISMQENDLVVLYNYDNTANPLTSGYTLVFDSGTEALYYKFMGSTPDTSVTVQGAGALPGLVGVLVFRGVHTTTPVATAAWDASTVSGNDPSPPSAGYSFVPVTVVVGARGFGVADDAITAPTGYSNLVHEYGTGSSTSTTIGMAWKNESAGSIAPPTFTDWTTSSTHKAFTLCLLAEDVVYPGTAWVVDTASDTSTNGADAIVDLSALDIQQNDVLLFIAAINNDSGDTGSSPLIAVEDAGWTTQTIQVQASSSPTDQLLEVLVGHKVQGAVPDTSLTISGSLDASDSSAVQVYVLRNIEPSAPIDDIQFAKGGMDGSGQIDPPSATAGADATLSIVFGVTGADGFSQTTVTLPTGYDSAFQTYVSDTNDICLVSGFKPGVSSGAENPGVFTGFATPTQQAFVTGTILLSTNFNASVEPPLFSNENTHYGSIVGNDSRIQVAFARAIGARGTQELETSLFVDTDEFYAFLSTYVVAPGLTEDADTFYASAITTEVEVSPDLFVDGDTFSSATVTTGSVDLSPSLYSDADAFHAPTVDHALNASAYTDTDAFYSPEIDLVLHASLYSDGETIYASAVSHVLLPDAYSDTDTFYAPTLGLFLLPALYVDADTIYSPDIGHVLNASLYEDGDIFYAPATLQTLTASLYEDADSFHEPSVGHGLLPQLYEDADTFYTTAVTTGAVDLDPDLYADGDTFHTPAVAHVLRAELYEDADTLHSATVGLTLHPTFYGDADAFLGGTVTAGEVDLSPSLYSDTDTFFSPSTGKGLRPPFHNPLDTFYSPKLHQGLEALVTFTDEDEFSAPTVIKGAATIAPPLFIDEDEFYAHGTGGFLGASRYVSPDTFPQHRLQLYLTPPHLADGDTIYSATVEHALRVSLFEDADTFYDHQADTDVHPELFVDGDLFYSPNIHFTLHPSLYNDADAFYAPALDLVLRASTFIDADALHTPAVNIRLHPDYFQDGDTFYAHGAAGFIAPDQYIDPDGFHAAGISTVVQLTASSFSDTDTFHAPSALSVYALQPELSEDEDEFYSPRTHYFVYANGELIRVRPENRAHSLHNENRVVTIPAPSIIERLEEYRVVHAQARQRRGT